MWPSRSREANLKKDENGPKSEAIKKLEQEWKKDKEFYEEALEARTNQLEEMETEIEKLKKQLCEQNEQNQNL